MHAGYLCHCCPFTLLLLVLLLPSNPEAFWKAYAADRYNLLLRGALNEGEGEAEQRAVSGDLGSSNGRRNPTKYLVYSPADHGLGNHISGMMSAFALSIATERVFLHAWNEPNPQ